MYAMCYQLGQRCDSQLINPNYKIQQPITLVPLNPTNDEKNYPFPSHAA